MARVFQPLTELCITAEGTETSTGACTGSYSTCQVCPQAWKTVELTRDLTAVLGCVIHYCGNDSSRRSE